MADRKQKLQQLMDELQDHYENLGEKEQGLANPATGLNCAAVFAGWLVIINNGSFQMTLESNSIIIAKTETNQMTFPTLSVSER